MRWIIRSGMALVALAAFAIVALVLMPAERIASLAAQQIEAATGRSVTIDGPVRARLWPEVGVATGPVRVANADWSGQGPMLSAQALSVQVEARALLGGRVRIVSLALEAPDLVLERRKDGLGNWARASAAESAGQGGEAQGLSGFGLAEARITDGRLRWIDHASGQNLALEGLTVALRLPDLAGPLALDASARMNTRPVSLKLEAADAAGFLAGRAVALRADATLGASRVGFDGQAGHSPLQASGALSADLSDRAALGGALALPDLPQGLGARVVQLDGQAGLASDGRAWLRGARLVLDENRLSLEADLAPGPRPRITARIDAGPLAVATTQPGVPGANAAPIDGWSTAPIDLGALRLADVDVSLAAPSLRMGGLVLGAQTARMTLTDGRAVITLPAVAGYDGSFSGTLVANARGAGSVRADLAFAGIDLQSLLRDVARTDRLIARADGRIAVVAGAASVARMMTTLQGDGEIRLGKGELRGLDLLGMLRTLDTGYVGEGQRTIFDSVVAPFTIAEGVLRADRTLLVAPYLRVEGNGTVAIGQRMLDYRLLPVALEKPDGTGGVKVPLMITGPWAEPRFRLDLDALTRPKLEAERARAEERVKEALRREAEERLGIVPGPEETLEDAAKRRLEEEAARALRRLLGGE